MFGWNKLCQILMSITIQITEGSGRCQILLFMFSFTLLLAFLGLLLPFELIVQFLSAFAFSFAAFCYCIRLFFTFFFFSFLLLSFQELVCGFEVMDLRIFGIYHTVTNTFVSFSICDLTSFTLRRQNICLFNN